MTQSNTIKAGFRVVAQSLADSEARVPTSLCSDAQPIVLVQGFAASSRVLLPLEAHLRRTLRRPVIRIRLGGRVPLQLGNIRHSAERVAAALEELSALPGFRHADLVGHSMGGLVATYVLKRLDPGRRIRRVITLGTPHRGTPLAWVGALFLGAISSAVWQMVPGSPLLRELAELPVPAGAELIAVGADSDAVVPRSFARVPGSPRHRNETLARLDHLGFLYAQESLQFVGRALAA